MASTRDLPTDSAPAEPPGQRGRRRLDASVPEEYDHPTRAPRIASRRVGQSLIVGALMAWALAAVGAGTVVVAVDAPTWIARPSAAVLMVVFTTALVHRAGGHMRLWVVPVAVLAVAALITERNGLLASAAVVTAVCGAVAAVMVTRPAETLLEVLREYCVAIMVALSAMMGVAAWNAAVNFQRFNLVVLALSLGIALWLVWSLGAGLHGISTQQLWLLVVAAVALVLLMSYASLVRAYGSQALVEFIDTSVVWARDTFGGIPRPVEVLIGFPALIVGVSLRARRREGWWVLVFAVLGTAVLANSLVTPTAFPSYIGLSTLYSVVLGLIVGLILRARFVSERSARAARRFESDHRVEPARFSALR